MEEQFMKRVLDLARQGEGRVSPNPLVGCVVVKNHAILAEDFHREYGGFHAERNALLSCGEQAAGADLYVNLEPCCHHGKTPPCTEIILKTGIRRVFVGCLDPNPLVAGQGIAQLRQHGVEVQTGILDQECYRLNEIFFHYIQTGRPFTAMKYAMTLDGRIAADSGSSQWITGEAARKHVHMLRRRYTAILAGIGTVLADDPMLDCRIEEGVNPVRILCDSDLRLPLSSHLVKSADRIRTIVACCDPGTVPSTWPQDAESKPRAAELHLQSAELKPRAAELHLQGAEPNPRAAELHLQGAEPNSRAAKEREWKIDQLRQAGVEVWTLPPEPRPNQSYEPTQISNRRQTEQASDLRQQTANGAGQSRSLLRLSLPALWKRLGESGIDSILVEGGGTIQGSLLREGLVNRVYAYLAPKLIGGECNRAPIQGPGILRMSDACQLLDTEILPLGEDWLVSGVLRKEKSI